MKVSLGIRCAVVSCVTLGVCALGAFRDDQTRDVQIVVSVQDDAGVPIQDVPLAVTRKSGLTFGKTDSLGIWRSTIRIAVDSQQEVVKVISESLIAYGPSTTDVTSQRVGTVKDEYAVPSTMLIHTATVQQQYSLTVVFPKAVHVSLVTSNGTSPFLGAVAVAGRDAYTKADANGAVRVGGVAKGQDCTLFVREVRKSGVRAIDILASQLQADTDIGTQVITFPVATCTCAFSTTHREILKRDPQPTKLYITAVSTNMSDLYAFPLKDGGVCFDAFATDRKVRLPAGEYYLVPGDAEMGRYAAATRKLLIDGRASDLQTAQVPRVVITAEQTSCEASVDMEAVRAAVAQLAGISY